MASISDFPARGRVTSINGGTLVFAPLNTNYELHLAIDGPAPAAGPARVEGLVRLVGRKVWTMPSGGNYITPIFGMPRVVQGRIKHIDQGQMVLQAGTHVIVELPRDDDAYALVNGPLQAGTLVNVTILPGGKFSAVPATATA